MPGRYTIDEGGTLLPGMSMLLGAIQKSRDQKRADEYLQFERDAAQRRHERESAALARQKAEDTRRHDIEAFNARPQLERLARRSVSAANMNPYGITFSEETERPSLRESGFQAMGGEDFGAYARKTLAGEAAEMPSVTDQVAAGRDPTIGQHSGAPGGAMGQHGASPPAPDELMAMSADDTKADGQPEGDPYDPIKAAKALLGAPGKRRVFGSIGGQRYELPEQSNTTGFGPEYDQMFNSLTELDDSPAGRQRALATVAAEHKSAQTQKAIDARTQRQIDARVGAQEDRQSFDREMGLSREDRLSEAQKNRDAAMARTKEGGKYRVAASVPTLKIDTANRQDMGSLRSAFAEWKRTVNLAVDSKSHKRLATAMSNLDSGNAMQQREAAESLVSIFKGGGQVTKASQDLLLKHLAGIVGDAETWVQHNLSGHFGSRELNVLQQATRNALKEEQERLHAYHESAADTFGPGSGWEQLGGNVNAMLKGAFRQFGYDAPDIYQNAPESVVLGSGTRPATPKQGAKPQKPAAQMVTIRNKKTGETKQVTAEEARKMGAAP